MQNISYINEKVKHAGDYDVVVIGSGTAGVIAAISAGREGLKTLVVEQFGAVGGSQTLSMVTPLMPSHVPEDKICCSIHKEIVERLHRQGHGSLSTMNEGQWFDPVYLELLLIEMLTEANVDILFYTRFIDCTVKDGNIQSVIIHNKDGLTYVNAKTFIDCSGDADLAYSAGVETFSGADETGVNQSVSLRFEMGGVDTARVAEFLKSCGQPESEYSRYPGVTTDGSDAPGFQQLVTTKCKEGELTEQDAIHIQLFSILGREGCVSFNSPELGKQANVLEAKFISQKLVESRSAVKRIEAFCKKNIPGFENSYINALSPMIGYRETRRIKAIYQMTGPDIWEYRKFDDAIATSNYPLDIHGYTNYKREYKEVPDNEKYFEIPFRSMVTDNIKNLVVAGRCIGADFYAQSTVRVQHSCRAMGEAAGLAAKIALSSGTDLNTVDGKVIREEMIKRGAEF